MKIKCILRMRGSKVEVDGIIDGNDVFLPNGKIANCEYWEILKVIEPKHCFWCCILSYAALVGAACFCILFWGGQ